MTDHINPISTHGIRDVVTDEEFRKIVDGVQKGGHWWPFCVEITKETNDGLRRSVEGVAGNQRSV